MIFAFLNNPFVLEDTDAVDLHVELEGGGVVSHADGGSIRPVLDVLHLPDIVLARSIFFG